MATGIQSFNDPGSIGAIYPFVGTEVLLVIVGVVLWLAWHVLQTRDESREDDEAVRKFNEIGRDRVMAEGGVARISDTRPGQGSGGGTPDSMG